MTTQSSREKTYRRGLARAQRQERCAATLLGRPTHLHPHPHSLSPPLSEHSLIPHPVVITPPPLTSLAGPKVSGELRPEAGARLTGREWCSPLMEGMRGARFTPGLSTPEPSLGKRRRNKKCKSSGGLHMAWCRNVISHPQPLIDHCAHTGDGWNQSAGNWLSHRNNGTPFLPSTVNTVKFRMWGLWVFNFVFV